MNRASVKRTSMNRASAVVLLLCAIFGVGCGKTPLGYQRHSYSTRNMPSTGADVRLPVGLWNKIEAVQRGSDESVTGLEIESEFMPIKVFLIEKNKGILGGRNHELFFSEGGGEIDLKDFVADQKGTFFIAFEPVAASTDAPPRVFYLSNATQRTLGRETLGAGCNKYFELTTAFSVAMKSDGIQANSTDGRHVSALAGTYFFAVPQAGKLHLAQVTIKDSRYRSLHCRR